MEQQQISAKKLKAMENKEQISIVHRMKGVNDMTPMKYNRLSIGIMLVGLLAWLVGVLNITNKYVFVATSILLLVCFVTSIIIHIVFARCKVCKKHLTRIWGDCCPHCGANVKGKL